MAHPDRTGPHTGAALAPLDPDRVAAYLDRIGVAPPTRPDLATLDRIHLAHLRSVPFENIDIRLGVPVDLDPERIYRKVVERGRGGWCFELNSAAARLLLAIGFGVDLLAGRVARHGGELGAPFEHLALRVTVPDGSAFLVDVGFGDGFEHPVPFVAGQVRADADRHVRLADGGDGLLYQDDRGDGWVTRYTVGVAGRRLDEFAGACRWLRTAPESHFTQQTICTIATVGGRVTLVDDRVITTVGGERHERTVDDDERWRILRDDLRIDPGVAAGAFESPSRQP